jgi:hypothetical protein
MDYLVPPVRAPALPEADRETTAGFGGIGQNAQFDYCRSTMGANCPTGDLRTAVQGGGRLVKDDACS